MVNGSMLVASSVVAPLVLGASVVAPLVLAASVVAPFVLVVSVVAPLVLVASVVAPLVLAASMVNGSIGPDAGGIIGVINREPLLRGQSLWEVRLCVMLPHLHALFYVSCCSCRLDVMPCFFYLVLQSNPLLHCSSCPLVPYRLLLCFFLFTSPYLYIKFLLITSPVFLFLVFSF
jgi:hypothetical protein